MDIQAKIGVIGMGSFGMAVADLLAENTDVLVYTRDNNKALQFNKDHLFQKYKLSGRITAISDLSLIGNECDVIFTIIPSSNFRQMMKELSPYLNPSKIIIHGTKGLDVECEDETLPDEQLIAKINIHPMSEVIKQESSVLRVGCLSGPNLAKEILGRQPAATVIASEYDEVIEVGQKYLSSKRLFVFGSYDLKGAELAGVLKNIYALASGLLYGKGYGKNMQAMLLTRGLSEMIALGQELGSNRQAFLGTAGVGDLIATATSELSRNYSFGMKIGKGYSFSEALDEIGEVVEGVRTLRFAHILSKRYNVHVPITQMIYKVVYEGFEVERAIDFLMRYPGTKDVDFI